MQTKDEMTVQEAATLLGTDQNYVRLLARQGKLVGIREQGGLRQWRLKRKSVMAYGEKMAERRQQLAERGLSGRTTAWTFSEEEKQLADRWSPDFKLPKSEDGLDPDLNPNRKLVLEKLLKPKS